MAQNLVVNFIGNNKLSKTTTVVGSDLKKLSKIADTTGRNINRALGAVGLGVGLSVLANGLKQATKAAVDDRKSQGLLALALKNTVGATSEAIAGAETYIKKTQLQTAVLDDSLRPALATAVRATGSLAGGQRLLNTALDVSAGTGKDLKVVTVAIAKAYNGQTGSLKKLLPSIKDGTDFMAQLNAQFQGSAEKAANLDPYKRLEIIFQDIQETIGTALLPALEEFSAYLISPEGQSNLKQIVGLFVGIGEAISAATKFLIQNMGAIKAIVAALVVLRVGWTLSTAFVNLYTLATRKAATATKLLKVALITTGIGALIVLVGTLASEWIGASQAVDDYSAAQDNALDPGQVTFKNWYQGGFVDPLTGGITSALRDSLSDPRITQEMKTALSKLMGKVVTIDFGLGAIFVGGKRVWTQAVKKTAKTVSDGAKEIRNALDAEIGKLKSTAETFRDSVGLAFGVFGQDENTVFNIDAVLNKMRRVIAAGKGFAANIAKLTKAGAPKFVTDQLVAMGPAQGNIVAKGLLASPTKLSEFVGYGKTLYGMGAGVQAQASVNQPATYEININKAVVSASDIIREIQKYEKKTGRKYLVTNG